MITRSQLLFAALIVTSLVQAAYGQSSGCRALEGAWHVTITDSDPAPSPGDFVTMITFTGETTIEHDGRPGWGPAIGAYSCDGGRTFKATWLKHIWDPATGNLLVIVKIRATIKVVSDNEYTSEDTFDIYAPNGTLISNNKATAVGKRIVAE